MNSLEFLLTYKMGREGFRQFGGVEGGGGGGGVSVKEAKSPDD